MDPYAFFEMFFTGVATDSQLSAWALANYGRECSIRPTYDRRNPPRAEECPFIALHSPFKAAHQEERTVQYGFRAYLVISTEGFRTRVEDNITEMQGTKLVSDFGMVLLAAVKAANPDNFTLGYELDTDTVERYPLFEGEMIFTFQESLVLGQNPLD